MEQSKDFFASLTPVSEFSAVTQNDAYTPLPKDWIIVLADVKGSTKAIQEGAYKNVNMVGAACIMGILNLLDETDLPYVFGGDGATLAIPASFQQVAETFLIQIRALAATNFGLSLRVGIIPVSDILDKGHSVDVLKYEVSPNLFLAMFSGGGLLEADRLLKDESPDNPYIISPEAKPETPPDLHGLSCRWEPIVSRNGRMVSLMINSPSGSADEKSRLYRDILEKLNSILDQRVAAFRPTTEQNLKLRWPPRGLWAEAKLTAQNQNVLKVFAGLIWQSFIHYVLDASGKKAGSYDGTVYRTELIANTDFQRFDDMIRLVLDCRENQIAAMETYLDALHEEGKIVYGMHQSDSALMTCLIFNLAKGAHIHFVDGGDGGFALAAINMKKQLAELAQKKVSKQTEKP
ncbi:DUF3095 domain-containing protein [Sneathiella aquimaris]|uniref:DUF3095 domain-containing protein n=1 Tax=Sneathiella aquimaris TaxID=2599305 RepID=UPI00146B95D8|nr:DUF3095 domain-containing protein [Sneathiella aquimaris]